MYSVIPLLFPLQYNNIPGTNAACGCGLSERSCDAISLTRHGISSHVKGVSLPLLLSLVVLGGSGLPPLGFAVVLLTVTLSLLPPASPPRPDLAGVRLSPFP